MRKKRDRTTLKSFFRNGALPTAEHYRDLIDSTVNHVEDGFDKTDKDGLKLNSIGSSLRVLSLYKGLGTQDAAWSLEHGKNNPGALHLRPEKSKKTDLSILGKDGEPDEKARLAQGLSISHDGRVGIGQENPDWLMDVNGVARMRGRIGVKDDSLPIVLANGEWHDITRPLTGCQAFEIVAGAGGKVGDGRYSMVYAIAMNAFNPRNRFLNWFFKRRGIKTQTAMYGSYADRIRFEWEACGDPHQFKLRMRTNAKFGDGYTIQYHITRLWFDSVMSGSRQEGNGRDPGLL